MLSIVALFISILTVSFTCSLLEAVILSVTPAFVAVSIERKQRSGVLLQHLIDQIHRPLSAILTVNTLSHTLGSAAIAYRVQHLYGDALVTVTSVILTLLILIFSEILPKSLGAARWKSLAPLTAYTAQVMILVAYPFVILSEEIGAFFKKEFAEPDVTREEFIMTAEIGAEEGTIKSKESMIIKNLLMLDKIFVADIMTPRSVIFALDASDTVDEVMQKHTPLRFSRVPVYNSSMDHLIGMTNRSQILEALSKDQHNKTVRELTLPISTVSERLTVSQALDFFIRSKEHLAIVTDDYGVITGLVTLEDAVETLLGVEIVDEFDSVEDMRKYALEQWQLRKQKGRK